MGSRSKTDRAYIAGFLDGDGSLMLQIKKRKDGAVKYRFMATICFYQDSRHEKPLHWIKKILGIGYVSRRNDGMSELRINGFEQVHRILHDLMPYLQFKKIQARALYEATDLLRMKRKRSMNLKLLVEHILTVQNSNYVTKHKKTRMDFYIVLGLTP